MRPQSARSNASTSTTPAPPIARSRWRTRAVSATHPSNRSTAEPSVDLRAAMTLAAERDSIARQYASGFRDIFQTGLGAVASAPLKTPATITLNVFLTFLGTWPDSHIVRKQGVTVAQSVTREARAASRSMAHRVGARTDAAAPRMGRRAEGAGHQPGHERRSHGRDAVRRRMHRAGTPRHRREADLTLARIMIGTPWFACPESCAAGIAASRVVCKSNTRDLITGGKAWPRSIASW